MLIVYRTATGEIVDNHGTSAAAPLGPPDDMAYINTDARGLDRNDLALLRLHDIDDEADVHKAFTHECRVRNGELVADRPRKAPAPPPADPAVLEVRELRVKGAKRTAAERDRLLDLLVDRAYPPT